MELLAGFGAGGVDRVEESVEGLALARVRDAVLVEPGDALGVEERAVGVGAHAVGRREDGPELRPERRDLFGADDLLEDLVFAAVDALVTVALPVLVDALLDPFAFERRQSAEESDAPTDDAGEFFAAAST